MPEAGKTLTEAIDNAKAEAFMAIGEAYDFSETGWLKAPHNYIFWSLFTLWMLAAIYACFI